MSFSTISFLFDVAKPMTDTSHLEIEKSTISGRPYQTGGGRTVNANVIDILMTWLVNRDREFLQGGATSCDETRHQCVSLFGSTKCRVADGRRECRSYGCAGYGLGADRSNSTASWHPLVAKASR